MLDFVQVHVALWERNANPVLVARHFDLLVHIEPHGPVVGGVAPWANDKVNATIGKLRDGYDRRGIFQYTFVSSNNLFNDIFSKL